jgi:type I restriction enzyme, S subunit
MELVTLSDCVKYFKGYAFKSQWYSADGHPIIKVSDFTSDSIDVSNQSRIKSEFALQFQKYAIHTGDVIIQTVGSWPDNPDSVVGKVVRANQLVNGALLNQNAVNIIPLNNINKTYLYYLLKSELFKGYIINTAQGAANQASITLESILGYKFLLPPLPTQRRIASILSAYDELIEVNNQRIKLLEETARQLYKEWFVRMRFPEYKKAKFVKGVPEGWEVKS